MYFLFVLFEKKRNQVKLNMGTGIRDVYQGVQGACPQQAVTCTKGMAKHCAIGTGLRLIILTTHAQSKVTILIHMHLCTLWRLNFYLIQQPSCVTQR